MTKRLLGGDMHVTRKKLRWSVQWEFKLADFWLGVFWSSTTGPTGRWAVLDVWVCLIPCLPIHFFFNRPPAPIRLVVK